MRWGDRLRYGGLACRVVSWVAYSLCDHAGMKEQASPVQYTIHGIPREVDHILLQRAAQRKQSLNQVILDELTLATVAHQRRADFSDLVGKWTPDPAFDDILAAQRTIDADQRKRGSRWTPVD